MRIEKALAWPVVRRVLFEIALPLGIAVAWLLIAKQTSPSGWDSVAVAAPIFAVVFYLQGQFFRIVKNVRDQRNATRLQDDVTDLKGSVSTLNQAVQDFLAKSGPAIAQSSSAPPLGGLATQPPSSVSPMQLMSQADSTMTAGHTYPALLLAAVAYEQAVRETAQSLQLFDVRQIAAAIRKITGEDTSTGNDLLGLWRLRNQLIHPRNDDDVPDRATARRVLESFRWGIDRLLTRKK